MTEYLKSTFLEDFSKKFENLRINKGDILNIDPLFVELFAEALGKSTKESIFLVPTDSEIETEIVTIGDTWDANKLINLEYERVDRVWKEGEFSLLGESIVIWPFSSKNILKIILWGNKVEEINTLEVESRKRISILESITLFGKQSGILGNENISDINILKYHSRTFDSSSTDIDVPIYPISNLNIYSQSKSSINILKDYRSKGFEIWYLTKDIFKYDKDSQTAKYIDRCYEISSTIERSIKSGFVYTPSKILLLTDSEVLGEIKLRTSTREKKLDISTIDLLKKIMPGDYVVHEDHGIGIYSGLVKKDTQQYLEISYAGSDKIFVPLRSTKKVMKYIGSGKAKPRLTGLNSGVWKRISNRAKEDIENIAKELLQIYALRKIMETKPILKTSKDISEYWKFAESFEFSDTEDQYLATKHIEEDLAKSKPMDRLIVGDVGFGKTEISMRAAFAVVNSGCQVAILAPTTVLVNQHLKVFKERFKKYPFNIQSLSRINSKKEREGILKDLSKGKIDILIGTHSLISKEVIFKDLGLIVIDEEQKFGVKQKEALKRSRVNSHVLSMTATPIPRTLNMALMGVRDITVLAIPPYGRKNIKNEFHIFDWDKITACIQRELTRGGQVYFLHNRISNINFVREEIVKRIPNIRAEVAHGRMGGSKLLSIMDNFINHDIDLLLCTTIIENGLDISNANTLIVDDVNRLGLSQMYQIRGRVGRGDRQAYACFMFDTLRGDSVLRLEAIRESESLGSGFILSNRDLEIRGAGDILGKKQSGTINTVGYGLYTQLLKESVERLKASNRGIFE